MPQRSKGPRLYLRAARQDRGADAVWVIRDGQTEVSTGCTAGQRGGPDGAEQALATYIAAKWTPSKERPGDPANVYVAEVLAFYSKFKAPKMANPASEAGWVKALSEWWGGRTLDQVKMSTCEAYVAHRIQQPLKAARHAAALAKRVTTEGARRELEVLSSAIGFWAKEYPLNRRPIVTLPQKSHGQRDALTRGQAAALLLASMGWRKGKDGRWKRLGSSAIENRRHLRRFILMGVYSGTRPGVLPKLLWIESPTQAWVDIDDGTIYRRGRAERDHRTKRRPLVRIPDRLLAHIRRWKAADDLANQVREEPIATILHHGGRALAGRIRTGFEGCVRDAGLEGEVTPHWMRHTCATWLMEAGVPIWDAAAYTGMSTAVLEKNYGHHRPDHQSRARKALGGRAQPFSSPRA